MTCENFIYLLSILSVLKIDALSPIVKFAVFVINDKELKNVDVTFQQAVGRVNRNSEALPNVTLVHNIHYIQRDESYLTTKLVCQEISEGAIAIFSVYNSVINKHIHSVCDAMDIPHFGIYQECSQDTDESLLSLLPSFRDMAHAYIEIMKLLNWSKTVYLYDGDDGLMKIRDMLQYEFFWKMDVKVVYVTLDSLRDTLVQVKNSELYNLIVDIQANATSQFLKEISDLNMDDYKFYYIFLNLDITDSNVILLRNNVNITFFRLIDNDEVTVQGIREEVHLYYPEISLNYPLMLKTQTAIIYDSVMAFAKGLQTMRTSTTLETTKLSCDDETPWRQGSTLLNYISSVDFKGLTGTVQFKENRRINYRLSLIKFRNHTLWKVGEWTNSTGINISNKNAFFEPEKVNITLIVTTIVEAPYVMIRDEKQTGNQKFDGFCIDLLKAISTHVGFNFSLYVVPDGKYGIQNLETKEWNGVVKELIDKKADLAVGSMSIIYARESVIDFTKPFMNLGISILFKVSDRSSLRIFSYMKPFAADIWLYVSASFVLVSATMYVVSRLSPYEWRNQCCDRKTDEITLSATFWFMIGTLMQQITDLNPRATSTRIVSGIWWFFSLVIISSYTANLAAFLTVQRLITPIERAEDLADQNTIEYGTLISGTTMNFFRDSKIELYQKMWRHMKNKKPSVFVSSYKEGIKRVLEGNFAFFMESSMLEYAIQRNCNLTQIGGILDSKTYGIATPKGSPWREKISMAILDLQEKQVIKMLYNKWWKNSGQVCKRLDKSKESKASALGFDYIGGIFIVLICGMILSVMVSIFEFCWKSREKARLNKVPMCSKMLEEINSTCLCYAASKEPVLKQHDIKCSLRNYSLRSI